MLSVKIHILRVFSAYMQVDLSFYSLSSLRVV